MHFGQKTFQPFIHWYPVLFGTCEIGYPFNKGSIGILLLIPLVQVSDQLLLLLDQNKSFDFFLFKDYLFIGIGSTFKIQIVIGSTWFCLNSIGPNLKPTVIALGPDQISNFCYFKKTIDTWYSATSLRYRMIVIWQVHFMGLTCNSELNQYANHLKDCDHLVFNISCNLTFFFNFKINFIQGF